MQELTDRQQAILNYIKQFIRKEGYPPTVRELAEKFAMKSSSMFDHLNALQRKGLVKRVSRKSRSLEVAEFIESKRSLAPVREIPLLGRVSAGKPLFAIENLDGNLWLDTSWIKAEKVFALKVKGESMQNAHILDGDIVMVRVQHDADNGDIVVVLLGDEATVKRFYRENGRIRLQPENPNMEPIILNSASSEFTILGKVIGVFRKF
ncbi:MAG: transcriptional repressor LexA [bacterium]|nr:transcriptional repressor LexA [bacterium]